MKTFATVAAGGLLLLLHDISSCKSHRSKQYLSELAFKTYQSACPKVQVLAQACFGNCTCLNVYLCMGVCFSCGPSNGHKAGSVCPLGGWNVHCGQQAASVLLNRSCPSYCTSCTMSFSLSLSHSVFLSLWPYTESGLIRFWLMLCWVLFHPTSPQAQDIWLEPKSSTDFITPLWRPDTLSHVGDGYKSLHKGNCQPRNSPMHVFLSVCVREEKEMLEGGDGCSPHLFCSHDHSETTRPHDFNMTSPALQEINLRLPLSGVKEIISCDFWP